MDSTTRSHAPLCRTTGGGAQRRAQQSQQQSFYPPPPQIHQHQPVQMSMSHPVGVFGAGYQMAPPPPQNYGPVLLAGPPPGLAPIGFNDFDSCYSSCDDISHPSLSRESSDPSKIDENTKNGQQMRLPSAEVIEFATKLGYTIEQLSQVLNNIGLDARMDDVLSELVKMGLPSSSSAVTSTSSDHPTSSNSHQMMSTSSGGPSTSSSSRFGGLTSSGNGFTPNPSLRTVVVDGSNVAMLHGKREVFSCVGLRSCLHYFLERGHPEVLIIIPQYRREQPRSDSPIVDQHILQEIERHIIYTPSRNVNGRRVVCHDDRYILHTAELKDAVIVSNDEYRDLTRENPKWRKIVDERLLMFTFVEDKFMPPDDPSGRHGPRIESFLSKVPVLGANPLVCPYARKCTYGNKCKFYHPERANGQHMSVTERLMKENQQKKSLSAVKSMQYEMFKNKHAALSRTQSLNVVKPLGTAAVENIQLTTSSGPHQMTSSSIGEGGNQMTSRQQHQQLQQANSAPWQQHQTVQRHGSSPLTPVNRQINHNNGQLLGNDHQNMVPQHQHGVIGSQRPKMTATVSQTHLFAPSTAVWGHSELSVGPLNTGSDESLSEVRARVHFHLCHIFPQPDVETVMAANPDEVNAPVLCELIIRAQKLNLRR